MNGRRLSRYWLLVPLIVAALIARDWAERPQTFDTEETVDMRDTQADYYLENFTTRRFDASGALELLISGETLLHYPDDDRSEVASPTVEMRRAGTLWKAQASRGQFDADPDVLTLIGDVEIERTQTDRPTGDSPTSGIPPRVTIRTADIAFELDSNEVKTERPFELEAPAFRLSGIGLRSSIDAGKLVLLSNVNGTYDAVATE